MLNMNQISQILIEKKRVTLVTLKYTPLTINMYLSINTMIISSIVKPVSILVQLCNFSKKQSIIGECSLYGPIIQLQYDCNRLQPSATKNKKKKEKKQGPSVQLGKSKF
jgi:hypothetical protein